MIVTQNTKTQPTPDNLVLSITVQKYTVIATAYVELNETHSYAQYLQLHVTR